MAVFPSRKIVVPKPTPIVTITGEGHASDCYVTINGTTYTAAASGIKVLPGDVITFRVYGYSSDYYGEVTIDGTQALKVTDKTTRTYEWTVPEGISAVTIKLTYTKVFLFDYGRITVTTS